MAPDLGAVAVTGAGGKASGIFDWDEELAAESPIDPLPEVRSADSAVILYTSGSSGWPKGVLLSHANYVFVGEAVSQWLRIRPGDRWLVSLPMSHGNSMYYAGMSALVSGASLALMSDFDATRWSEQAQIYEATLASLFAAQMRMILAQPPSRSDRRHALRAVIFAQNLTRGQLADFEERFNIELLQLYGMTETVAPSIVNPLYGWRNNLSMGHPAMWTRIRLVDEDERDVKKGEVGQLLVHGVPGRSLMVGYYGNEEATRKAIRDRWLYTGDFARADENGFMHFVGRGNDLIKPSYDTISAVEIERVVQENWAVRECAVIGVRDAMGEEVIKLCVELYPEGGVAEGEIVDWCRQHLAEPKVPAVVEIVDELPRTAVGKVDKMKLRQGRY